LVKDVKSIVFLAVFPTAPGRTSQLRTATLLCAMPGATLVPFINVVCLVRLALTFLAAYYAFRAISSPIRIHPIHLRRFYGAISPRGSSILAGMEFL
jgi:hypothetical protein